MPRDWPKVEELYHAALEKQPAEREAFLQLACGGDDPSVSRRHALDDGRRP